MCGIAGLFDSVSPPSQAQLERMAEPLIKRGPDDGGFYLDHAVGLAFRRLSIIDLAGGHQPLFNEDGNLAIVFNGEIYNFQELRQRLVAREHRFTTESDTETLIHLYEEEGPEMVRMIQGMFAFVIYDRVNQLLFMARDRFGKKPFFYAVKNNRFAFASGPESLLGLSWIDNSHDLSAIHDYLEYQYIPTPRSIYNGIKKLPPGYRGIWQDHQLKIESYWEPRLRVGFNGSYLEACGQLRGKLREAVRKRLVADVPLGMFLSGGMDSSVICALAQQELNHPALTFSIGFPEKKYDEREYARMVSRHLGTDHHFLEVIPNDFAYLKQIVRDYEEPFCDASMLPTALLAKFTRQFVTVALSGDGADELFGGYYRYQIMDWCRRLLICPESLRKAIVQRVLMVLPPKIEERTFWGKIRRLLEISQFSGLKQYLQLISRCPAGLKESLYGDAMLSLNPLPNSLDVLERFSWSGNSGRNLVDEIMEIDQRTYLVDDILVKVDRASMAYGLEVRSPYLDTEVAEFAMSLPYHWKQQGRQRKMILTDACSDLLPKEIFKRNKLGFGVPLARWLRGEWREPAMALLMEGNLVRNELFRRDRLEWLVKSHLEMKADHSYVIFALVVLELWLQDHLK